MCRVRETARVSQGAEGQEKSKVMSTAYLTPAPEETECSREVKGKGRSCPGKAVVRRTQAAQTTAHKLPTGKQNHAFSFQAKEKKSELLVTIAGKELEAHHLRLRDSRSEKQEFESLESFRG